jgi:hypothetical protein
MKTGCMIMITLLLTVGSLSSQSLDCFGYFESQLLVADIKSEFLQLQTNKCRLDLEMSNQNFYFAANLNATTYHGRTRWKIPDYLPEPVAQSIPDLYSPYYVLVFKDEIVLDNAFLRIKLPQFDVTLGKQQISTGSGYLWNPTDLFNQKDLFDPTYEQPGHNAIRLDIPLASRLNGLVLYAPSTDWATSTRLISLKVGFGHFDYTLMMIDKSFGLHDFTHFAETDFLKSEEDRKLIGGSLVGELFGAGFWTEYGYNKIASKNNFQEITVGMNYTFDFNTFVMIEYFRSTLAKTHAADYTLNDWMRYLTAEQKALNQDQIYLMLQHPLNDLTQLGISLIAAGDGSLALIPTLNAVPFENIELICYMNVYSGKNTAVFNASLGNGGLIRVRAYF